MMPYVRRLASQSPKQYGIGGKPKEKPIADLSDFKLVPFDT